MDIRKVAPRIDHHPQWAPDDNSDKRGIPPRNETKKGMLTLILFLRVSSVVIDSHIIAEFRVIFPLAINKLFGPWVLG
jgi:hypothetical protein